MAWEFKVGDRVKCIDDVPVGGIWSIEEAPIIGGVCTIESVSIDNAGYVIVTLHEIKRDWRSLSFGCYGYYAARFRPIRKTDISSLQEHLLMKPVKQLERIGARDE